MNQREEFYRLQLMAKTYRVPYREVEHGFKVLTEELTYDRDGALSSLEATFAQQEHSAIEERHRRRFLRPENFDMQQDRRCVE